MRMNDERGCSICRPGEERYEVLGPTAFRDQPPVHYDYRTPDGALFSTVAPTLTEARARRDRWALKLIADSCKLGPYSRAYGF